MNLKDLHSIYCEPFGEYKLRRDFISPSDIKGCETPSEYKYKRENPNYKDTPVTLLGSYFHATILEPNTVESEFAIWKNDMKPFPDKNYTNSQNKKARDEFITRSELKGIKALTDDIVDTAVKMYESVLKSKTYLHLFNPKTCICEYSFLACAKLLVGLDEIGDEEVLYKQMNHNTGEHEYYGLKILPILEAVNIPSERLILLKCRPDAVSKKLIYIGDIKSTWNASPKPNKFAKQAYDMDFPIQAAMYIDIVNVVSGSNIEDFYFGVCKNTPPFDNGTFKCHPDFIEYGRKLYKTRLIRIKLAENSNYYESYDIYAPENDEYGILTLNIPYYAKLDEIKF
jgi:hypothetical protein